MFYGSKSIQIAVMAFSVFVLITYSSSALAAVAISSSVEENPENFRSTRVAGGQQQGPHQFPFLAAVNTGYFNTLCAGALLNYFWLVTAASCVDSLFVPPNYSFNVTLGAYLLTNNVERGQVNFTLTSKDVVIHPGWDRMASYQNNIALLKLPFAPTFNVYVQPIPLPRTSQVADSYAGLTAVSCGWGQTSGAEGADEISQFARWANFTVIFNAECGATYAPNIYDTDLCTSGATGTNDCDNDQGAPLFLTDLDGVRTLIGIYSWGDWAGCPSGKPSIFTRMTSYETWISQIAGLGIRP